MFIFMKAEEKKYPNCIREIRMMKGISAYKLAEMIGTSKDQIEKLQKGERRLTDSWLKRLSEALGCTKAELLGESPALTPQDMALINLYNALPPEHQETILKLAKDMVALNSDGKKTASGS